MFTPLSQNNIEEIVQIQLNSLAKRLKETDIIISATPEAIHAIGELGYDPQFGARPVKRVIQKHVLNELSKKIIAGEINSADTVTIDFKNDHIDFKNS